MDGVILFADDKIHSYSFDSETNSYSQSDENKLFKNLANSYPILGVKDLDLAEKTLKSIGSFSALILDWQFAEEVEEKISEDSEDERTVAIAEKAFSNDSKTFDFLMNNEIYSLIYIYSTAASQIEEMYGDRLRARFQDRVHIKDKKNISNTDAECGGILQDIIDWKVQNKNISVPIIWNQSINKASQSIFLELVKASPKWIKDIYNSACDKNGAPIVDPIVEVMNLFQHLLSEKLIQDFKLREIIKELVTANEAQDVATSVESYVNLFQRFFYSKVYETDPLMTGDIFCFDIENQNYGILITPECDVLDTKNKNLDFEFLTFNNKEFKNRAQSLFRPITANKIKYDDEQTRELLSKAFNQNDGRFHLLPSFHFPDSENKVPALIDFRFNIIHKKYSDLIVEDGKLKERNYKYNSPYILQLRQRYLAYKGRVGVPANPTSLIDWNINL